MNYLYKILLGVCFCFFTNISCTQTSVSGTSVSETSLSYDYKSIDTRSKNHDKSIMVDTGRRLKATYDFFNDSLDYFLTAKGAVKTMVLMTPFFMVYCRYFETSLFDSKPIMNLIKRIMQYIGKAEELYKIQKEIGRSEAFWETLYQQPWKTFCVTANKLLDKTIYIGIPFIAGMLCKVGIGIK